MSNAETALNIANLALGIAVLACLAVVAAGVIHEVASRIARRAHIGTRRVIG